MAWSDERTAYLTADHGQRLALCGVDLARHDARPRLVGRQARDMEKGMGGGG